MARLDKEALEAAFNSRGWQCGSRDIEYGIQFELQDGVKVNLYTTGKTTVGGPKGDFKSEVDAFVKALQSDTAPDSPAISGDRASIRPSPAEPRVFVVYGHDAAARDELELILRRVHVQPIILQNIPGVGETLIEKLESLTDADFACVLLTPDDVGGTTNTPTDSLRPRARQNVVLELGMVLSRLGRRRVAILVKGDELEKPSDIDGLIYIPFNEQVGEAANTLGAALATAGFSIDVRHLLG